MEGKKIRERIGRTIYTTHCIGSRYDPETRMVVQFNEVISGKITTLKRAAAVLKKRMKCEQLIVEELHHFKAYASAPIDKFLEICDVINEQEID